MKVSVRLLVNAYTFIMISILNFSWRYLVTAIAAIGPIVSLEYDNVSLGLHIATTNLLFSTASTPICAKLSDVIGRKLILLISSVLYTFGSLLSSASTGVPLLLLGRSISDLGLEGISVMISVILSGMLIELPGL